MRPAHIFSVQGRRIWGPREPWPGHPLSLIRVFAVRIKKPWILSYPLSAHRRLWSDWAYAQADLSLCWVHSHYVGFVMRGLKRVYLPYFAMYYARSRIIRTWFLVSIWLEKVLFPYIIRSNFWASVPWCINTSKSEFSGGKFGRKQADFAGGYDLFRAELTR